MNEQQNMHWYVVHTQSNREKDVMKQIRSHALHHKMEDKIGDIIVPSEEVVEIHGGKKRRSERKFFPGYVLVKMLLDDATWHMIKDVPYVIGFIGGTSQAPKPLSEKEAQDILTRVEEGVTKPKPKIPYEPGETVRVVDGPFVDFNGIVEEVNYEKNKLRVAVLIFGRSTPVELEFSQVEKL